MTRRRGRASRVHRLAGLATVLVAIAATTPAGVLAETSGARLLWAASYDGRGHTFDYASALGVSADGSRVFVTGQAVQSERSGLDYATAAYDAATGVELWVQTYDGPRHGRDYATALAVDADARRVFVTGSSTGLTPFDRDDAEDYATVAYAAGTGRELWVRRFNGRGNDNDNPEAIAVSPDGSHVFVTGKALAPSSGSDYRTVAYDASTGSKLWTTRYAGTTEFSSDHATAIGVSPDGSVVFVTGKGFWYDTGPQANTHCATVAYEADTGARLWVRPTRGCGAQALDVSDDGSQVVVTGSGVASGTPSYLHYVTVAFDAATGARTWIARHGGAVSAFDSAALDVDIGPDGSAVFVTGYSRGGTSDVDYTTVAYDAIHGAEIWARRYDGPAHFFDQARALDVSPDGAHVFVTGSSAVSFGPSGYEGEDVATVAYAASTGATSWVRRYDGPAHGLDFGRALGVAPDGTRLYVAGGSEGGSSSSDYSTLAYALP